MAIAGSGIGGGAGQSGEADGHQEEECIVFSSESEPRGQASWRGWVTEMSRWQR